MKLRKAIIIILAVLVLVLGGAWLWIDQIAKAAVEKGAGHALGVKTEVNALNLSLLRGRLTIDMLDVANPEGFSAGHFMQLRHFDLQIVPGSVMGATVDVPTFDLDGLDLVIEQTAKGSNVGVIIDNVKRLAGPSEAKPAEKQPAEQQPAKSEGKKVKVAHLVIKNVTAHFKLLGGKDLPVTVPEIVLNGVTSDDPNGMTVSKLVATILPAILTAVAQKAQGIVPAEFLTGMNSQVAGLTSALGGQAAKLAQQANLQAQKAAAEIQKAGEKSVTDAAKNLLPPLKKPDANK